jgi:hypothetical protein
MVRWIYSTKEQGKQEIMYDVMKLQVPTSPAEAEELLRVFVKDYNGGFHPDDSGAEIVGPDGSPAFTEENAAHYDELNQGIWAQLSEDAIYSVLDEGRDE